MTKLCFFYFPLQLLRHSISLRYFFVGSFSPVVRETLSSTKEFNGSGNPDIFPFKSKQQIAAKLLDMFGYVKLKVRASCWYLVKPVASTDIPAHFMI